MFPIQDSVPSRSVPVVTRALILINVLVFFFELMLPRQGVEQLFYIFGLVPARFTHPDWAAYVGFPVDSYWPILTHQFLHVLWFFINLVSGTAGLAGPQQVGGIAWWAHVGGFVSGMLLCRLFLRRRRQLQPDEYGLEWAWEPRKR